MLFSSLPFFLFFAAYFLLHLTVPARWRLGLIILGSTFFYGYWDWRFIPLPFALLAIAYVGVWWMERTTAEAARRHRMIATVTLLLLPLIFFKYVNFLYRDLYGLVFPLADSPLVFDLPWGATFTLFPAPDRLLDTVL